MHLYQTELAEAYAPMSVSVTLEDDIDIGRGDMIVKTSELPKVDKDVNATICWMDTKSLTPSSKYILQHGVNKVLAKIAVINSAISTDFSRENKNVSQLDINQIGEVKIKLSKALYYDSYAENKSNGSFILIDPQTNTTAGVGFIK